MRSHSRTEDILTHDFRALPFKEITLWQMFNCLADGLAMLENGVEYPIDGTGKTSAVTFSNWDTMVHMDLKPPNSKTLSISTQLHVRGADN